MFDRETISLWIHTTGQAVIGAHKGKMLKFLPSTVTTWKRWRAQHPKSLVLNVKKGKNAGFHLQKKSKTGGISVGEPNRALKLYPLSILRKQRLVNDTLDNKKIVVVFHPDDWVFAAFERGDRQFVWKGGKMIDQTGKQWDMLNGTSGKLQLKPIPAVTWYIKAWKRFYPEGVIYAAE